MLPVNRPCSCISVCGTNKHPLIVTIAFQGLLFCKLLPKILSDSHILDGVIPFEFKNARFECVDFRDGLGVES